MMDPAKLKVVELRAELSKRGLDTKGNKPVLVERLRKALEEGTEDNVGQEIAEAIPADDNSAETAHKNAREKTPEPVAANKTPGRSSRSASGTTPTKATPARINPKIVLTPIPEKQSSPAKSPIPEKQTTPTKSPIVETQVTPTKSPVAEAQTTPTKSPMVEKQMTPTKSPTVEKQMTPTKSPTVEKQMTPTKSPTLDKQVTPTKSPTLEKQVTPTMSPVLEKQTTPIKSPIEEKQLTPSKTPIVEKPTTPIKSQMAEKTEIPSETITEEKEKQEEVIEAAGEPVVEAAHNEVREQTVEQVTDEVTKTDEQEVVPPNQQIEEKVSLEQENKAEVSSHEEEEEESSHESQEQGKVILTNEKVVEDNDKVIAEEQSSLEAKNSMSQESTADNEPMETDNGNEDSSQPIDAKPEVEDHENIVETEENATTENSSSRVDEHETKVDVLVKEEVDVKPNIDNTLQADDQSQDVEMKNVKVEEEDDSERDSKDHDRRDRKDRKRKRSPSPQEEKAKSPQPSRPLDEPALNETDVVLSWYDSDLNLVINKESFLSATAMHNGGFGYIWAGARASYGFTEGKVYYEAKITEYCEVDLEDEQSPHVLRVGWSVQGTSMQLGEEPLTYGFGGTGKISTGNRFSDYGIPFGKDDVIGCYLNFTDSNDVVMSYTINGKDMGPAFTVSKNVLEGKPLYPHILTKNCTFVCNFGQEKPWSEEILEGYVPVGSIDLKNRVLGPCRPEKTEECEIIMMCGLPAAGKTVWATKYAANHPEKMFNILGTNNLIEKMKVIGLPRRRNYHGRWDALIEKCTKCLNKLLEIASTRRRNYILDQTNVYPSAQRRKMRGFYGYHRRAIVIVPTEEEFKSRTAKRTASEGEVVPESGLLEMKANFGAPVVGETFDVVEWVELPAEEGKKLIEKYNKEGKEAGYGQQQQASKRPRFERNDNHRDSRESRQNSRDNRDNRDNRDTRDSRDNRDNRDHRDRRNNYQDRNRNSTWRVGSNSGGWRDRQPRPAVAHARHGGSSSGGSASGSGYGPSGGGWRGRGGSSGGPPSSYRPSNDRRVTSSHDRRTSGMDRNRSAPSRQGGWSSMSSYQSSQQQPSGSWGGSSQSGSWQGSQQQQQASWPAQSGGWGQQQQQWGNWKSYGQGSNYSQGNYSQQGYGNGSWAGWNQQYYNQYWGQQQPSGQTSTASSQAANTSSSTPTGNSTSSTGSTYSNYSSAWQGYTQPYGYSAESSNTNTQQQK